MIHHVVEFHRSRFIVKSYVLNRFVSFLKRHQKTKPTSPQKDTSKVNP